MALGQAPLFSSASIDAAGTSLDVTFDIDVQVGAGSHGGFVLVGGAGEGLTFSSVSGDTLTYSISPAVAYDTNVTLNYTQPTDGIEEAGTAISQILSNTEEFNTGWTPLNITVSNVNDTGTLDPIGTNTADRITEQVEAITPQAYSIDQVFSSTSGTDYTFSVYAKHRTSNEWIQLAFSDLGFVDTAYANFNCNDGTEGTVGAGLTSSGKETLSNGWYRFWIRAQSDETSASAEAGVNTIRATGDTKAETHLSALSDSLWLWGANLTATTYAADYIKDVNTGGLYDLADLSGETVTRANSAATGVPTISGTETEGETLTAAIGTTADLNTFTGETYEWFRGVTTVGTGTAYVLQAADVGSTMTVVVSFTDAIGYAESRTSSATGAIAAVGGGGVEVGVGVIGPALGGGCTKKALGKVLN